MFRKRKIIVLVFMFGIIFLGMNATSAQAQAQPDNFPIGMYIVYNIYNEIPPAEGIEFTIRYDFRRWINQESLLVEYEKEDINYIKSLLEIAIDGPDHVPIWMDVSTWQLYDSIKVFGMYYGFIQKADHWVPPLGDVECYRLEYVVQNYGRETASTLWYHGQLGVLVDYNRVDWDLENNTLIRAYSEFIFGSNLDDFNPPTFTVQEPTQTTTATTSTPTTSPPRPNPPSTTTSTIISITPQTALNVIIGVGIAIEISLIILIVRTRK